MFVFAFLLLASTTVVLIPLFHPGVITGHDIAAHLIWTQLFFKALSAGQFPVRFTEGVLPGMDSPQFIFYPSPVYYLTAIFQALKINYVTAIYLSLILLTILGFIGIYLLVREYFDQLAAVTAAVVFTISPYRILQLYVRAALSEYLALSVLPFVFWGLSLIFKEKKIGTLITALALALLAVSHQPSLFMALPIIIAFVIAQWIQTQKNSIFFEALKAGLIGAGLTGYYILPAILERQYISSGDLTSGYYNFRLHFAQLSQIIFSKWGWGTSQMGLTDGMSFGLGILGWLIVLGASILFFTKTSPLNKFWSGFFTIAVVYAIFLSIETSKPIWEAVSVMAFIQYPWRFISIATLCYSLLVAPLTKHIFVFNKYTNIIFLFFLITLLVGLTLPIIKPATYLPRDKFDLQNLAQNKGAADPMLGVEMGYLPIYAKTINASLSSEEKIETIAGEADTELTTDTPAQKTIHIKSYKASVIRIHSHYFPGWKATINPKPFTQELTIDYNNAWGFMDINVPQGEGDITLSFTKTRPRIIGEVLTLITLGLLIFDQILSSSWKLKVRQKG